jgi:hypothetical protein
MSSTSSSGSSSPVSQTRTQRNNNFLGALKTGQIYEELYANILYDDMDDGEEIELAPNKYFPDWDIKTRTVRYGDITYDDAGVPNIDTSFDEHTYEVKGDIVAQKHGNIAIEVATKPVGVFENFIMSGLNATKADTWVHFIHQTHEDRKYIQYIVMPTEKMREYARPTQDGGLSHKQVWGGNDYRSRIHLIPISEIPEEYKFSVLYSDIEKYLLKRINAITPVEVRR